MENVTSLWSSKYKIAKVIKLFKKLPQRILGELFMIIMIYFYNYHHHHHHHHHYKWKEWNIIVKIDCI